MTVTSALEKISKDPKIRLCVQMAYGGLSKTGEGSLDKIFAGLYPFVSRTVHEFIKDFKLSHPGLEQHHALRHQLGVIRCIAKAYEVDIETEIDDTEGK